MSFAAPDARAGAIYVPNQGVRAESQGGAWVASADDTTALYWNPAALVHLDGWGLGGGLAFVRQPIRFQRTGGEGRWKRCHEDEPNCLEPDNEDGSDNPAHASMLARPYDVMVNEAPWRPIPEVALYYAFDDPDLTIALGLHAPVAPWFDYPVLEDENADVPLVPTRYRLVQARLDQGRFALGFGWQATPWLAVGANFEVVLLHLKQRMTASAHLFSEEDGNDEDPQYDVDVTFEATGVEPYGMLGAIFTPVADKLDIGLAFQPPLPASIPGGAKLVKYGLGERTARIVNTPGLNLDTEADGITVRVTLPPILRTGVALKPHPNVLIEVAGVFEFWSMTKEILAEGVNVPLTDAEGTPLKQQQLCLTLPAACEDIPDRYRGDNQSGSTSLPAGYRNTARVSVGGRFTPLEGTPNRPELTARTGVFYETSGVPDEAANVGSVDNQKVGVGAGFVFGFRGFEAGFSYSRVFVFDRDIQTGTGTQIVALEDTVPNVIDDGQYSDLDVDFVAFSLNFNIGQMIKETRAAKAGG